MDTSIPPLPARQSSPGRVSVPAAAKAPPRTPDLDWSEDNKPVAAVLQSTMQGTALESAPEPPRRSRVGRLVAIVALAGAAALCAVYLAQGVGETTEASASDSLDELVEQARECARTRSWDSPPGANVRDVTARALEQAPNEKRVLEIRRESAEKIVTEALGRKYAGSRADAQRLAKLALELDPTLTTAQHLVQELEDETPPEAATETPPSGTADVRIVGGAKTAAPKSSAKPTLPPATATASVKPSAVSPAKTSKPQTPPTNTGAAVLPPPTSTGPWL